MSDPIYRVPRGASRVIDEFSVTVGGVAQPLTGWTVTVVVDGDTNPDTAPLYSANCEPKPGDATKRLVVVEGAATATEIRAPGCVHVVDPNGKPDSVRFILWVEAHA